MKNFENYLEERFNSSTSSDGVLDDDLEDAFEDWLANLDIQKVCDYAEIWGKMQFADGVIIGTDNIMKIQEAVFNAYNK